MQPEVDRLAKILWDYNKLGHELKRADVIIGLGSHDTRVAERAAELYLQGYAPVLVFSGNRGVLTKDLFEKPEAEVFADAAVQAGVPREKILLEPRAANTGENIDFVRELLKENGITVRTAILVQKPYMERRTFATAKKRWPELEIVVTSPQISYEEYPDATLSKEHILNVMVGDTQRIREYPKKGFQVEQPMSKEVSAAFKRLVELGYTKHLIRD